jgi:hypothetical protein
MLDDQMTFYFIPDRNVSSFEELLPYCDKKTQIDSKYRLSYVIGDLYDRYGDSFWESVIILSHNDILQKLEQFLQRSNEWWKKEYREEIEMIRNLPSAGVWVGNFHLLKETPEMTPWLESHQYMAPSFMCIEEYYEKNPGKWRTFLRIPNNGGDEDWCGFRLAPSFDDNEMTRVLERIDCYGYGVYPYLIQRLDGSHIYLFTFALWHA